MPGTTSTSHFRVSPMVLGPLGAEQLQDPALAVLELVKNAWDADAKRVAISVDQRKSGGEIVVIDNGHGMSQDEFETRWLVIGASHKRGQETSENGRPLIGEKGLGRLSSFALGRSVTMASSRRREQGFVAKVDWEQMRTAPSLEEYLIAISSRPSLIGARVAIHDLNVKWNNVHTEFLVTHAQFLVSVPGQHFRISLRVDGKQYAMDDPLATVSRLAEAEIDIRVLPDGTPKVRSCIVDSTDETNIVFRQMKKDEIDPRLAGVRLSLKFFRRDEAAKRLSGTLQRNEVTAILERYQGVRIYRNGINIPPYGLNRDDWAGLEKQRTSTGGPTLVPGNSQLIGEVHITRRNHPHFVVTAGRSGFSDQGAVGALANYVRWAVRELGTARRAEYLGIKSSAQPIPSRIDEDKSTTSQDAEQVARRALTQISKSTAVQMDLELRKDFDVASKAVADVLDKNEQTLRLYAQLASTGIAATSFAHELRAEFDVVSEGIDELGHKKPDKDLLSLLKDAWKRISAFAALFRVVPIKLRRQKKVLTTGELRKSLAAILGLAPPDKVETTIDLPELKLRIVPADLDSILLNLVSNAVKAVAESNRNESGLIRVSFRTQGEDLDIRVADNGCGVTQKVAAIMFEPLEGHFAEGTGMGLPIAKYIAGRYGGDVMLTEIPTRGYKTEMMVKLRGVVERTS